MLCMKFIEINIHAFGKFSNERMRLSDNVNVLHGGDESGKATIAAFLYAMLFGIQKPKISVKDDLYSIYYPTQNPEKFGGMIVFEHEKKLYRLTKNFAGDEPKVEFFSISQNMVIEKGSEAFREMLMGMSQDKYITIDPENGVVNGADDLSEEEKIKLEEERIKKVLDALASELQERESRLSELEKKSTKLEEPTLFEKEEHEFYENKTKFDEIKKELDAVEKLNKERKEVKKQKDEADDDAKKLKHYGKKLTEIREFMKENDEESRKCQKEEDELKHRLETEGKAIPKSAIGMLAAGGVLLLLGIVFLIAKLGMPVAVGAMVAGAVLLLVGFLNMGKNKGLAADIEGEIQAVRDRKQALDKEREKFLAEHDSEDKLAKLYDKYLKKDTKKKEIDEKDGKLSAQIAEKEKNVAPKKKELLEFFKRFGELPDLNETRLKLLEEKLLSGKEERISQLEKTRTQIRELKDKIGNLHDQVDREKKNTEKLLARKEELRKKAEEEARRAKEEAEAAERGELELNPEKLNEFLSEQKKRTGNVSQMYLAIRMAASDMMLTMFEIPLFFDDSFEYLDDERMEWTLRQACSHKRQKIILCCNDRVEQILQKCDIDYKLQKF